MPDFTSIRDFGDWEPYTPAMLPEDAPPTALFARRKSDGTDWYSLAHVDGSFGENAVIAVCDNTVDSDVFLVQAIVRDPQMAPLPAGRHVIVIDGVDPSIELPHKLFEQMLYTLSAGTITPKPPPPVLDVSAAQALIILERTPGPSGKTLGQAVEEWVNASGDRELKAWYTRSPRWFRDSPNIAKAAAQFGLSSQQVQGLFNAANEVQE